MTRSGVCWGPSVIVCAAIVIPTLACSEDVAPVALSTAESAIGSCAEVDPIGVWWNQEFPEQRAAFVVELDATPSATGLDAVVGLASGTAASFSALAAIVRFNAAGAIDVRAGSAYRADVAFPYAAGHTYHLRFSLDVGAHSYSVQVREGSAAYTTIATGYAFRTEQAGVTGLDHVASEVDSTAGSLEVCGVSVSPPSGGTCLTVSAGQGFVSLPVADATGYEEVTMSAQAGGSNIDAVFGLSAGPATTYSDIAAAVRFAPSGNIDVRDGDSYRADVTHAYPSTATRLRLLSDLATHTYSVFQDGPLAPGNDVTEIARQYRFRTEQAAVSHLDHLSAVVDGDHGSAIICIQVSASPPGVYSREGSWAAAPLADDEAVLSDGATTAWVDAAGRTVATIDHGGVVATDPLGHGFVASVSGSTLTVERYARPLTLDWRASIGVASGSPIRAVGGRADGGVTVALGGAALTSTLLLRFTSDGTLASTVAITGTAVAIDGDQAVAAWQDGSDLLRVIAYSASGTMIWGQTFSGRAAVTAIAVEPDHDVIFGGELFTSIDFGGGPIELVDTDDGPVNGFIVKLSNTGAHVFSGRNGYSTVTGLAGNDRKIAMSGTRRTQFFYKQLAVFDANTAPGDVAQLLDNGRGGGVAMSPSGRVWWSFAEQFLLFNAFPYLLSFPGGG
jgi:hypothetical protein